MRASESKQRHSKVIPTGIFEVDDLLDGGVPLGKITQFSGVYAVGKSNLAALAVASAQRLGYPTLWLDSEQRFFFEFAVKLGIDLDKMELEDLMHAEDLFNLAEEWVKKHKHGLVVLDSIGGLLTRKEAEKHSGEEGYPEAPKLIPAFIRRTVIALAKTQCALILLNHEKVQFDGSIKVMGGRSVEYHSDKWLRLRRISTKKVMSGDERVGDIIEISVQKGPKKWKKIEIPLISGEGFARENSTTDEALNKGVIERRGNSFFFEDVKIAVGQAKLREALKDEVLLEKIKSSLSSLGV